MDRPRPKVLAERNFEAHRQELEGLAMQDRFTRIHDLNLWGAKESVSGLGSEMEATARLRGELERLIQSLKPARILDLPCGDFGWMKAVDLAGADYTGIDIVIALIERNNSTHARADRRFLCLDVTTATPPPADLVICRDLLVHFSFSNIAAALHHLRKTGATWLLTTTFTDLTRNRDIKDGDWRALNLEAPPFSWPRPAALIIEGCEEEGGAYRDKALGLWRFAELNV